MKNLIIILLLLACYDSLAQNQYWFADNDVWNYRYLEWYDRGYKTIWVSGEIEDNGQIFKRISTKLVTVSILNNNMDTTEQLLNDQYYYVSNDSVWVAFSGQLWLLYNFNMIPGDSMRIVRPEDIEYGCPPAYFYLDSITTPADLGGRRVQWGHLESQGAWWTFFTETMVIVEGIGMIWSSYEGTDEGDSFGFLNLFEHFECATDVASHWFCSFSDGTWVYQPDDLDCFYLPPPLTSTQEAAAGPIKIYPNPVSGHEVFVDIIPGMVLEKISLYNFAGQLIRDLDTDLHSFSVDGSGLFFLVCNDGQASTAYRIVVK